MPPCCGRRSPCRRSPRPRATRGDAASGSRIASPSSVWWTSGPTAPATSSDGDRAAIATAASPSAPTSTRSFRRARRCASAARGSACRDPGSATTAGGSRSCWRSPNPLTERRSGRARRWNSSPRRAKRASAIWAAPRPSSPRPASASPPPSCSTERAMSASCTAVSDPAASGSPSADPAVTAGPPMAFPIRSTPPPPR